MASRLMNRPIPPTPLLLSSPPVGMKHTHSQRQAAVAVTTCNVTATEASSSLSGSTSPGGDPDASYSHAPHNKGGVTSLGDAVAHSLSVGMKVWLEDRKHVYRLYGITAELLTGKYTLALVTSNNDQQKTTRSNNKSELDVNRDRYFQSNPQTKADMAMLPFIHDPGILHNIHSRFIKQDMPYTFATSTCLICVTPTIRATRAVVMESYIDRYSSDTMDPHPYAIAEFAYQSACMVDDRDHTILLHGVSGSGKTECLHLLLQYYTYRCCLTPDVVITNDYDGANTAVVSIQDALTVIEAFTTVSTKSCPSSSRCIKHVKLHLSKSTAINGTQLTCTAITVDVLLLQKHLIHTGMQTRGSFHIVHQLIRSDLEYLMLHHHHHHHHIHDTVTEGGDSTNATTAALDDTTAALLRIGYTELEVQAMWKVMAGIIHLASITFEEDHLTVGGVVAKVASNCSPTIRCIAELWGVPVSLLLSTLTSREVVSRDRIIVGKNKTVVNYSSSEACAVRDDIMRTVHEELLSSVVFRINGSITDDKLVDTTTIGLIDLLGYDNCPGSNDLSQLITNYANEYLQHVMDSKLSQEIELYEKEGVLSTDTLRDDDATARDAMSRVIACSTHCIDMIGSRSGTSSVFTILDGVSRQQSDDHHHHHHHLQERAFFDGVNAFFRDNSYCSSPVTSATSLIPTNGSSGSGSSNARFTIKHFFDTVEYVTSSPMDWVVSNQANRSNDLMEPLYLASSNPQLMLLLSQKKKSLQTNDAATAIDARRPNVMMKPTTAEQLSKYINSLNSTVLKSHSYSILCIKPSLTMATGEFDKAYVLSQLRSLNLITQIKLRRQCLFPLRFTYADLFKSMHHVMDRVSHHFHADDEDAVIASIVLRAFGVRHCDYRPGTSLVFFRSQCIPTLQAIFRPSNHDDGNVDGDVNDDSNNDLSVVLSRIQSNAEMYRRYAISYKKSRQRVQNLLNLFKEVTKKHGLLHIKQSHYQNDPIFEIPDEVTSRISRIESLLSTVQRELLELYKQVIGLQSKVMKDDDDDDDGLQANSMDYGAASFGIRIRSLLADYESLDGSFKGAGVEYEHFQNRMRLLHNEHAVLSTVFHDTMRSNSVELENMSRMIDGCDAMLEGLKNTMFSFDTQLIDKRLSEVVNACQAVDTRIVGFQRGVEVCYREYDAYEYSRSCISFDTVSEMADSIIEAMECISKSSIPALRDQVAALVQEATNELARVAFTTLLASSQQSQQQATNAKRAPPPPPQLSSQPPAQPSIQSRSTKPRDAIDAYEAPLTSTGSDASSGGIVRKKGSITFSIKHLTALRKQRSSSSSIIISIPNTTEVLESHEMESGQAIDNPPLPAHFDPPPDQQQQLMSTSMSEAAVVSDFFSMDECYSDVRRSSGQYVMKGEQTNASRAALKTQLMRLKKSKDQDQQQPLAHAHTAVATISSSPTVKAATTATADIKPILSNLQTPANPLLRSKKHKARSTDKTALEGVSIAADELPPGWMEKVDKRSSRTFYVNTDTKEKQWQRPVSINHHHHHHFDDVEDYVSPSSYDEERRGSLSERLSNDLKMMSTSHHHIPSDRGPSAASSSSHVQNERRLSQSQRRLSHNEYNSDELQGDRRYSLSRNGRGSPPTNAASPPPKPKRSQTSSNTTAAAYMSTLRPPSIAPPPIPIDAYSQAIEEMSWRKVAAARKLSSEIRDGMMDQVDNAGKVIVRSKYRNTVSYLARIGNEDKRGVLLKQGKLSGVWRKRFFVLSGSSLEYWDSEKQQQKQNQQKQKQSGKRFVLSGACQTSYTSTANCFSICSPDDNGEGELLMWYVAATTEREMDEWKLYIDAHIHSIYTREYSIASDYWNEGGIGLRIFQLPPDYEKSSKLLRPVGIRSLPIVDGPRTGDGIFPGDVFEVVQTLPGTGGQTYLRLSSDRGWLFHLHPKGNFALMNQVDGDVVEDDDMQFVYSNQSTTHLAVYTSPTCGFTEGSNSEATALYFPAGSIFSACAVWTTTYGAIASQTNNNSNNASFDATTKLSFVKLLDDKGWVSMQHRVTAAKHLARVQ